MPRERGIEIFRPEVWRDKALAGIEASLKERKGDPVKAEPDIAMMIIPWIMVEALAARLNSRTSSQPPKM